MVTDVWSRKIIAASVYQREDGNLASRFLNHAIRDAGFPVGLVVHSDRGVPMKATATISILEHLGVQTSFSRPRVCNDNPYSEALFRTFKYRPDYPSKPFPCIEAARDWTRTFVTWYNTSHRHSAIAYVTPEQRHTGEDKLVLQRRKKTYETKRKEYPKRWISNTWHRPEEVFLNPSPENRITLHLKKCA
jgi:transposase InsO family protein